jgi:exonuclease 1
VRPLACFCSKSQTPVTHKHRSRQEALEAALRHMHAGRLDAADKEFAKAVDVTPLMARELVLVSYTTHACFHARARCLTSAHSDFSVSLCHLHLQELRRRRVACIVAPYEADAQMAYLSLRGDVAAVVTEDSDLLAYGCPKVINPIGLCHPY